MRQHEQSKGGARDESKEKNELLQDWQWVSCCISLSEKITMFGSAIFYPAMLENEEDTKIKLPLLDQYHFRFGP